MNQQTQKIVGLALIFGIASYLFSLGDTPWFITASAISGMVAGVITIAGLVIELTKM